MKTVFLAILVISLSGQIQAQSVVGEAEIKSALAQVGKVGLHGAGHADAVEPMKILNSISSSQIPLLFEAFDDSNPVSANWIRAAIQKASAVQEVPTDEVEAYFRDQSRNPKGRWLAWNMLASRSPEFKANTIDQLVMDSSMPLREIGIAKLISDADEYGTDVESMAENAIASKLGLLNKALENARDVEQIRSIAKSLKPLGKEVNLREHLGFIDAWSLVAGFDNKNEGGFDVSYEPEADAKRVETAKAYTVGKEQAAWVETTDVDELGVVDLNVVVGKEKGVIAYAASTFNSASECNAEVRIGTPNAHKIWVNGELVMSNEIYHNSNSIDKFSAPVKLAKGDNQVLVKLCQNEQTQPWAQDWSFQLRFCDATGKPVATGQ